MPTIIDKQYVLDYMHHIVINFLYYDRKGDEDLTYNRLHEMLDTGEVTIDEIVESFKNYLNELYNEQV